MCGYMVDAPSASMASSSKDWWPPQEATMPESDSDCEEQLQELELLKSMYMDDLTVLDEAPLQLEILVSVELGGPRPVLVVRGVPRQSNEEAEEEAEEASEDELTCGECLPADKQVWREFVPAAVRRAEELLDMRNAQPEQEASPAGGVHLRHLPPLVLSVTFGRGYPSKRPPHLQLSAQWLSGAQLAGLCSELDRLAEESAGQMVVWTWVDWLQNGALPFLGLDGSSTPLVLEASSAVYDDPRALSELDEPQEVLQRLRRFDREHSWWTWQQTAHSCCICLEDKPGTAFCEVSGCGHRFCTECVAGMMEVHISEGTIAAVRCPLPDCRCEVAPRLVRQLVSEKLYQRWRRLQVQKILSELPAIVFCPRCESNGWETPVLPSGGGASGNDAAELPLAVCDRPNCQCAFCPACRDPYHPNTHCNAMLQRLEKLKLLSEAAEAARVNQIRRQHLMQELESLKMILAETVPCPKCKIGITRSQGCNHMICTNCRTHFCYRCGADITTLGYDHFRADRCPTFDREEVERLRATAGFADGVGQDALEDQLQELLLQYPEQAHVVADFRAPNGAWRRSVRRRQANDMQCASCGQWNPRKGTNNHVRCQFCKTNLCYQCKKVIRGIVTHHFKPGGCAQHS